MEVEKIKIWLILQQNFKVITNQFSFNLLMFIKYKVYKSRDPNMKTSKNIFSFKLSLDVPEDLKYRQVDFETTEVIFLQKAKQKLFLKCLDTQAFLVTSRDENFRYKHQTRFLKPASPKAVEKYPRRLKFQMILIGRESRRQFVDRIFHAVNFQFLFFAFFDYLLIAL